MMGLLDQLTSQIAGKFGAQPQDSMQQNALLNAVMGIMSDTGGLSVLLQKLKEGGLEEQLASWVGTGENLPVSGEQIKDALGEQTVQQIAQQASVAPEHASSGLAQLLPQIIDKLTPGGQVPQGDLLQQGLSLIKGRLFG